MGLSVEPSDKLLEVAPIQSAPITRENGDDPDRNDRGTAEDLFGMFGRGDYFALATILQRKPHDTAARLICPYLSQSTSKSEEKAEGAAWSPGGALLERTSL